MNAQVDLKVYKKYLSYPYARFGLRKVEVFKLEVGFLEKVLSCWTAYIYTESNTKVLYEIRPNAKRSWFEEITIPLRYYFESSLINLIRKLEKPETAVAIVIVERNPKDAKDLRFKLYLVPEGKSMKQLLSDYGSLPKLEKVEALVLA